MPNVLPQLWFREPCLSLINRMINYLWYSEKILVFQILWRIFNYQLLHCNVHILIWFSNSRYVFLCLVQWSIVFKGKCCLSKKRTAFIFSNIVVICLNLKHTSHWISPTMMATGTTGSKFENKKPISFHIFWINTSSAIHYP